MKIFNKVAIIGTGLIGGSIALGIKQRHLSNKVVGITRHRATLSKAVALGIIDKGSGDIDIIKDADLVILATPIDKILSLAPAIAKKIKPGCIVIDVGSTKARIVSRLDKLFDFYVGTHPLSGSEKRGALNASAGIFKESICILTPTKHTSLLSLKKIRRFWNTLGARVILMSPQKHDKIISYVSHLPHAVAFSLIRSVPKNYLQLAAGGLRDTTRIAASDPQLWSDIFLSNPVNTLSAIKQFKRDITKLEKSIKNRNRRSLFRILNAAKSKHQIII